MGRRERISTVPLVLFEKQTIQKYAVTHANGMVYSGVVTLTAICVLFVCILFCKYSLGTIVARIIFSFVTVSIDNSRTNAGGFTIIIAPGAL